MHLRIVREFFSAVEWLSCKQFVAV